MFRINAYISDMRKVIYMSRADAVLNMQLTLIPILAKEWNISFSELSRLFHNYDILSYIDTCYERYNSTGNQGIIDDLRDYIEMQGGSVAWKIWLNLCYKALSFSRRCSFWRRISCMAHCNDIRTSLRNRGYRMINFFKLGDQYAAESTWKDFALVKFCLCAIGVMIGTMIPKKHKRTALRTAGTVFLVTYIPLMTKVFRILLRNNVADWSFFWLHFRL